MNKSWGPTYWWYHDSKSWRTGPLLSPYGRLLRGLRLCCNLSGRNVNLSHLRCGLVVVGSADCAAAHIPHRNESAADMPLVAILQLLF